MTKPDYITYDDLEHENYYAEALRRALKEHADRAPENHLSGSIDYLEVHLCEWSPDSFWERINKTEATTR